jgi:RNA polymerase sigma-70 factor (ECF subfamily)
MIVLRASQYLCDGMTEESPMSTISPSGPTDDLALIEALRRGDEAAFVTLVSRYHHSLLRVASLYVSSGAAAEDVVQETWLGVLRGLERFEGRSSLKTWIFRILVNRAKTRGERERRSIPFSALDDVDSGGDEPAVDPERFLADDHPRWPHHWASFPRNWEELPEHILLSTETRTVLQLAIDALPSTQREVITLRDIEGWSSEDVCHALVLTETNQRVLLHRARSRVRRALEQYLD